MNKEAVNFRNDYVFKKVFDHDDVSTLVFLVNSVLDNQPVSHLTIKNSEQPVSKVHGKRIYYDIKAQDQAGNDIIIEMQDYPINSVQEDRFVFMACKSYGSQLAAGEDYHLLKKSEVIIFCGKKYSDEFHVKLELNDLNTGHTLMHQKVILHFISLPAVDQIVLDKEKTGEPLSDLEILSLGLWKGVNEMTYKKANDEQKKILMVMEDRLESLYNDPQEMTYAEQLFFHRADLMLHKSEGIEEGLKEGRKEGMKAAILTILHSRIDQLSSQSEQLILNASKEKLDELIKKMDSFYSESDILNFFEH